MILQNFVSPILKTLIPAVPVSEDLASWDLISSEQIKLMKFIFSEGNPMRWRVKTFWRCEKGKTCLAGFIHPKLRINESKVAFFGFWHTVEDLQTNQNFFLELENWAKKFGVKEIYGPINFSTAFQYRLQLNNFDGDSFWGEPQNPAYYNQLLTDLDYKLDQKYISYFCEDISALKSSVKKNVEPFMGFVTAKYQVIPIEESLWQKRGDEIFSLTQKIFEENFAYTPFKKIIFKDFYVKKFLNTVCRDTSFFIEDKETKKLAAMAINLSDSSCDSSSTSKPMLLIKTVGVEKKHRNMGSTFLMILQEVLKRAENYDSVMFCLMKEGNFPSLLSKDFIDQERQYALFKKTIA